MRTEADGTPLDTLDPSLQPSHPMRTQPKGGTRQGNVKEEYRMCTPPHLALHKDNRQGLGLLLVLGHCCLLNKDPKQVVQLRTPPTPVQAPRQTVNQPYTGQLAARKGHQGKDCS